MIKFKLYDSVAWFVQHENHNTTPRFENKRVIGQIIGSNVLNGRFMWRILTDISSTIVYKDNKELMLSSSSLPPYGK